MNTRGRVAVPRVFTASEACKVRLGGGGVKVRRETQEKREREREIQTDGRV